MARHGDPRRAGTAPAIGPLACDTGGRAQGARVTLLVRPEAIVPDVPAGDLRPNVFAGRLAADRFLGPTRRVDLDVAGGFIHVETRLRSAFSTIAIPPEAIRLLPSTPSHAEI